ncbi:MAG: potassium transporter KefB [Chrysiogenales bacterium]|nr:MAG: potassium transporter KefB [Chrysiogenales bacterium]
MELLSNIIIVFSIAIVVLFICVRLKIPAIAGLLITGIITGPHALSIVETVRDVEVLAEIGVILLLFTIGIELSIKQLLRIRRSVFLGGALQVGITLLATAGIMGATGRPWGQSVAYGFLVSLSSTAVVLKVLQERSDIDTSHGRTSLGILIFQDIIIVPMMLALPLLTEKGSFEGSYIELAAKAVGIILVVFAGSKWIVPWVFHQIARTRSRELFMLGLVVLCFAIAWLTHTAGLSLALGAFLAGLIVSETEYGHEAIGSIVPFRDVFTSIFFVSVGMLLDLSYIAANPLFAAALTAAVLVLKFTCATVATMFLGYPLRTVLLVGFALCQIGEFSFILSKHALDLDLLTGADYQAFLTASIFTMIATPFIITLSPRLVERLLRLPLPERLKRGFYEGRLREEESHRTMRDHLVIVGFGVNGRNVSRSAKMAEIPYVVIEMNPDTVKQEREKGESIFFGDASHEEVLRHACIGEARVIVIAIPDAAATRRIVVTARRVNPIVHIITRTRYVQEVNDLFDLGANEVIPEEYETSVEIFARVLHRYMVPQNDIARMVDSIRADGYGMLRGYRSASGTFGIDVRSMKGMEFITLRVEPGATAVGRTIAELAVRKQYGATIIAIYRGDAAAHQNPDGDAVIEAEDIILLLGPPEALNGSISLFIHERKEGA